MTVKADEAEKIKIARCDMMQLHSAVILPTSGPAMWCGIQYPLQCCKTPSWALDLWENVGVWAVIWIPPHTPIPAVQAPRNQHNPPSPCAKPQKQQEIHKSKIKTGKVSKARENSMGQGAGQPCMTHPTRMVGGRASVGWVGGRQPPPRTYDAHIAGSDRRGRSSTELCSCMIGNSCCSIPQVFYTFTATVSARAVLTCAAVQQGTALFHTTGTFQIPSDRISQSSTDLYSRATLWWGWHGR